MRKDIVKRSKLLIVDDQEANVGLLLSILREQGFLGLQSLTDARLVLPLFLDFQPDLVLLDLRMPHIDGLSLLKQLRSRIADNVYLPFVIVTADLSQRTRQAALSLGAKDFLRSRSIQLKRFCGSTISWKRDTFISNCRNPIAYWTNGFGNVHRNWNWPRPRCSGILRSLGTIGTT